MVLFEVHILGIDSSRSTISFHVHIITNWNININCKELILIYKNAFFFVIEKGTITLLDGFLIA